MLTVRQFRYFQALAETLHFGRAARRLNVSQPALSAQIAQMEETLGAPLFERRPAGVTLSRTGEAARPRIEAILSAIRDLEGIAEGAREPLCGRLRLGLIATVAPYLLPKLLPRLAASHPRLDLAIRESLTAALVADIVSGDLDCALLALPIDAGGLLSIDLFDDPFLLAVPKGDAERFRGEVSVDALGGERLILLEEGHCLRDQALTVCHLAEASAFASLGATSLTTILRMVAGGLGATLLPSIAVEAEGAAGDVEILPFGAPVPSRRLALAFRRGTTRQRDFEALAEAIRACRPTG